MGVDTRFKVWFGLTKDYNSDFVEGIFNEHYSDDDCPSILIEGYEASWMMFGVELFTTESMRWEAPVGFTYTDISYLFNQWDQYKKSFNEKFGPEWSYLVDGYPKIISFVHYS